MTSTRPLTSGKPFKVSAPGFKTSSHTTRRLAEVRIGQLLGSAGAETATLRYYDSSRGSVTVEATPVSLGWVIASETSTFGPFDRVPRFDAAGDLIR